MKKNQTEIQKEIHGREFWLLKIIQKINSLIKFLVVNNNEKYYNFTRDEQRKMLIADVKKYNLDKNYARSFTGDSSVFFMQNGDEVWFNISDGMWTLVE